jgi:hypothetical protein
MGGNMAFFIGTIALLQILGGVLTFLVAKSAIHEILGSLSFGMGMLSLALAAALVKLDQIRKASEEAAASAAQSRTLQSKVAEAFDRIGQPAPQARAL